MEKHNSASQRITNTANGPAKGRHQMAEPVVASEERRCQQNDVQSRFLERLERLERIVVGRGISVEAESIAVSLPSSEGDSSPTAAKSETENFELPGEVSTAKAAKILGVSKDTVLRLKEAGLLEYRNASPPASGRPVYRFALESVLKLRLSYATDEPTPDFPREPSRRSVKGKRKYKYIDYD